MDWQAFEAFCVLERRMAGPTLKVRLRWLRLLAGEGVDLDALTVDSAKAALARYLLRADMTEHSYNGRCKALKDVLRWKGLDAAKLPLRRMRSNRYKFLTEPQVRACLAYRAGKRDPTSRFRRALLLWALKSAMRVSEVAGMDLADLDAANRRFFVRKPAKRGPKRWLPVEAWVFSPKRAISAYLNSKETPKDDPTALWVTEHRGSQGPTMPRRATTDGLRRVMAEISRELGFTVNFTVTRHTRATELRRRGWDVLAIQVFLGHSSPTHTQVYAAVTDEDLHGLMRRRGSTDPFAKAEGA